MSTTVTYKGATLVTIDNATKKLLTAGKYMEDDVTITDTPSGGDIPIGIAKMSFTVSSLGLSWSITAEESI